MPCSGARWRTCLSNGNAPGTRAAGAGGRIEGKAYLPKGSGLIRLNFEEVAGRRFDPCRRMEIDGGVGSDLHAARGNEGCSVRISTNVCEYGLGRAGAAQGGRDHRPNQERREPRVGSSASTVTVADVGGALSQGACRAALQAGHGEAVPKRGETLHPACLRPRWRRRGRARAHHRTALRARRYALSGEPGAGNREQAVQPRRVVEASHGQQPMQVRAQVPGEEARTVPYQRGVPPSRRRPERDGDGQDACQCTRWRRFAF